MLLCAAGRRLAQAPTRDGLIDISFLIDLIPLYCPPQSLFECHLGLPAKAGSDQLNIQHAAADIVDVAAVDVGRLDFSAEDLSHRLDKLYNTGLDPCSEIENQSLGFG